MRRSALIVSVGRIALALALAATLAASPLASASGQEGIAPPPPRTADPPHHYHLMLYALRLASLGLDAGASPAQVAARARAAALAEAQIVGLYGR